MNGTATPILRARQRGVVLVISLLMLLVLTVIGLAATRSTALEERMTANQNDQEIAFQGAEAALRYGEGLLSGASQPSFANNTAGAFTETTMGNLSWQTIDWSAASSQTEPYGYGIISGNQDLIVTGTGTGQTAYRSPRFYIVYSAASQNQVGSTLLTDQALSTSSVYFIYARGWGQTQNDNVNVTLEAVDSFH